MALFFVCKWGFIVGEERERACIEIITSEAGQRGFRLETPLIGTIGQLVDGNAQRAFIEKKCSVNIRFDQSV